MISQPGALESPQSLMGQNLHRLFKSICKLSKPNILCGNLFSCHGREDADSPCMHTHRRSPGWMPSCGYEEGDQEELQTKMNAFSNEELTLQTYLTQTLYCSDSALLGEITSLFLLLWISNHSISDSGSNALFSAAIESS